MKINPNAPAYPIPGMNDNEHGPTRAYGIPIRLAIAAQIMAGFAADPTTNDKSRFKPKGMANAALSWADDLIAAHNEGQS